MTNLRGHFRERFERYSKIIKFIGLVEEATRAGDFITAQSQLRTLAAQHPDIPFAELVKLPIQVETTPAGATVSIEGQPVGESPLVSSFVPGRRVEVRINLDGFFPERVFLNGDEVGRVTSMLARVPTWKQLTTGAVDRAPSRIGPASLRRRSWWIRAVLAGSRR